MFCLYVFLVLGCISQVDREKISSQGACMCVSVCLSYLCQCPDFYLFYLCQCLDLFIWFKKLLTVEAEIFCDDCLQAG